jgi:hypothetical protein
MDRRDFLKGLGVGAAGLTLGHSLAKAEPTEQPVVDGEELRSLWTDDPETVSGSCTADYVTLNPWTEEGEDVALLAKAPHLSYAQQVHRYTWDGSPNSPVWYIGGRTQGLLKLPRLVCPLADWNYLIGEHIDPCWARKHRYIDCEFAGKDKPVGEPPDLGMRLFQAVVSSVGMVHMFGVNLITSELALDGIRTFKTECMGQPVVAEDVSIVFQTMDLTWANGKKVDPKGTTQQYKPIKVVPGETPPLDVRGMV